MISRGWMHAAVPAWLEPSVDWHSGGVTFGWVATTVEQPELWGHSNLGVLNVDAVKDCARDSTSPGDVTAQAKSNSSKLTAFWLSKSWNRAYMSLLDLLWSDYVSPKRRSVKLSIGHRYRATIYHWLDEPQLHIHTKLGHHMAHDT